MQLFKWLNYTVLKITGDVLRLEQARVEYSVDRDKFYNVRVYMSLLQIHSTLIIMTAFVP